MKVLNFSEGLGKGGQDRNLSVGMGIHGKTFVFYVIGTDFDSKQTNRQNPIRKIFTVVRFFLLCNRLESSWVWGLVEMRESDKRGNRHG